MTPLLPPWARSLLGTVVIASSIFALIGNVAVNREQQARPDFSGSKSMVDLSNLAAPEPRVAPPSTPAPR